jgi:hypothetical protein
MGRSKAKVLTISRHLQSKADSIDRATSTAIWIKAYVGMHKVEYFGVYCQGAICGDWSLSGSTGGFWIWPGSVGQFEFAEEQEDLDQRLELVEIEMASEDKSSSNCLAHAN